MPVKCQNVPANIRGLLISVGIETSLLLLFDSGKTEKEYWRASENLYDLFKSYSVTRKSATQALCYNTRNSFKPNAVEQKRSGGTNFIGNTSNTKLYVSQHRL